MGFIPRTKKPCSWRPSYIKTVSSVALFFNSLNRTRNRRSKSLSAETKKKKTRKCEILPKLLHDVKFNQIIKYVTIHSPYNSALSTWLFTSISHASSLNFKDVILFTFCFLKKKNTRYNKMTNKKNFTLIVSEEIKILTTEKKKIKPR